MRWRFIRKFIAIFLLMIGAIVVYIFFVKNVLDKTGKYRKWTQFIDHDSGIVDKFVDRQGAIVEEKVAGVIENFTSFCERNKPDWLKIIQNSLTTLDHFEDHLHELVTDVAVGTRIMEAQMNILLRSELKLSSKILDDLKLLQRKCNSLGDSIYKRHENYTKMSNNSVREVESMKKNIQWIRAASTWETPPFKQWKTLMMTDIPIEASQNVSMDASFGPSSDGCIFGTFESCDIPDYCIDFFWRVPHSGYKLTHQILFHYMIVQNKCFTGKRKIYYESLNLVHPKIFLEMMCRIVLTETRHIELIDYPEIYQDLFVEQTLVCSLAGYNDFLTRHWTIVMQDWVGGSGILGCYSIERLSMLFQSERMSKRRRRVKRWDNHFVIDKTVCSVHMGALILGVVGQQLRYYMEMCLDSNSKQL